jgi:hypothetical protein
MKKQYKFVINSQGICESVDVKMSGLSEAEAISQVNSLVDSDDIVTGEKTTGIITFVEDKLLIDYTIVEVDGSWDDYDIEIDNPFI